MLKFIKYHLASIEGMDTLASIALILFIGIFLYVSYYAFFVMSKETSEEISDLPFHEGQE
jgi:cbb3-type cytochrome oxidase subunit 3